MAVAVLIAAGARGSRAEIAGGTLSGTTATATVTATACVGCCHPPCTEPDSDGDGVPDTGDACAGTEPGTAVDARGCSVHQLCVAADDEPPGECVSCIARTSQEFVRAGWLEQADRAALVRGAPAWCAAE